MTRWRGFFKRPQEQEKTGGVGPAAEAGMGVAGAGEGAKVGREGASREGGGSLGQERDRRRKSREREIDRRSKNQDREKGNPGPILDGGDRRTKGRSRER